MIIVYCCTRNWYKYLLVNLFALLQTNEVKKIYLFIEDDLLNDIEKIKNDTEVEIINYHRIIDKYIDKNNKNKFTRFGVGTLIRLLIPKILKEDKVLYIDVDAIVLADISELYNTDIDNYYIAASIDKNISLFIDYLDTLQVDEREYLNVGILLLNLKKIRADKIDDKWLKLLKNNVYRFPDQDIINIACKGFKLEIDNKYNCSSASGYADDMKIRHFVGTKKDWVKGMPYDDVWYKWEERYNNFMNNTPDYGGIDIIMPAYNAHEYITRALDSVAIQTIKDKCIVILVDDASNKGYEDIIEKYKNVLKIKHILLKKNRGVGGARQAGLDNATSKYTTFLDADDYFYDKYSLERMYNAMIYNPKSEIIFGKMLRNNKEKTLYVQLASKLYRRKFLEDKHIKFVKNRNCYDDVVFSYQFYNSIDESQIEELYNIISVWSIDNDKSVTKTLRQYNALIENIKEIIKISKKRLLKKYYILICLQDFINYDKADIFLSEKERVKFYKLCNKYYKLVKNIVDKTINSDKELYKDLISFIKKISDY